MPLKHRTETRLVLLLGAAIALTGFLVSMLPPLPLGALPWGVLLVLAVLYPLFLHPLFRLNRADNAFRWLHLVPAGLLLLWMGLQLLSYSVPATQPLPGLFTWGWTAGGVIVAIIALIAFCLKVIRQRVPRVIGLLLIFIPFFLLAGASEAGLHLEQRLASALWPNAKETVRTVADKTGAKAALPVIAGLISGTSTSSSSAASSISSVVSPTVIGVTDIVSLEPSESSDFTVLGTTIDPSEEAVGVTAQRRPRWVLGEEASPLLERVPDLPEDLAPGGTGAHLRAIASAPHSLPSSGFHWGLVILMMLAMYCGVLHDRARKRM